MPGTADRRPVKDRKAVCEMGKFRIENYTDLSNERGFQFEFRCDGCGRVFKSDFDRSETRILKKTNESVGKVANFLGNLFGGKVNTVGSAIGSGTGLVSDVSGDRYDEEKKKAFEKAEDWAQESLKRCKKCGNWFCEECYDTEAEMCAPCAEEEKAEEEKRRAEEEAEKEEREREEEQRRREAKKHVCPKCHEFVPEGMRFCGICGAPMVKVCPSCGAENEPRMNFCTECGTKLK